MSEDHRQRPVVGVDVKAGKAKAFFPPVVTHETRGWVPTDAAGSPPFKPRTPMGASRAPEVGRASSGYRR